MNYEKIGEFIQEKRKEKNLTQNELAHKIGVTDKAVSKWERGLGCPDVSLLEILAKELGVSVLELLKGRKIENEVINVTEADDYVKDTIKVSDRINKDKNTKVYSNIIFILLTVISLFLIIMNVKNMMLNKKETLDSPTAIKEEIDRLKDNIVKLDTLKGKYSDEDFNKLKDSFTKIYDHFINNKLININDELKITAKDYWFELDTSARVNYYIEVIKNLKDFMNSNNYNPEFYLKNITTSMLAVMSSNMIFDQYYFEKYVKYLDANYSTINQLHSQFDLNYIHSLYVKYNESIVSYSNVLIEKLLEDGEL